MCGPERAHVEAVLLLLPTLTKGVAPPPRPRPPPLGSSGLAGRPSCGVPAAYYRRKTTRPLQDDVVDVEGNCRPSSRPSRRGRRRRRRRRGGRCSSCRRIFGLSEGQ